MQTPSENLTPNPQKMYVSKMGREVIQLDIPKVSMTISSRGRGAGLSVSAMGLTEGVSASTRQAFCWYLSFILHA